MCIAVELVVGKGPVVAPWSVHGFDMQQIASFALELIHTHMDFELRLEVEFPFCRNSLTTFHFVLLIVVVVAAEKIRRGKCLVMVYLFTWGQKI